MIILQLSELLKQHNMSVYRLHQIIKDQARGKNKDDKGLSQKALYALTWRQPKQIDLETMNKICSALSITDINELLKIVPDEKDTDR